MLNIGYYSGSPSTNRNSFQLVLVERFDIAAGDFDFMFNYDQIQWEAGQASSSDMFGCGGVPAHVGWTNGVGTFMEFAGSGVSGAFLDSGNCSNVNPLGPNVLITHSLNSNTAGQYLFNVRNGVVQPPPGTVPEPGTLVLFGTGVAILGRRLIRRKAKA